MQASDEQDRSSQQRSSGQFAGSQFWPLQALGSTQQAGGTESAPALGDVALLVTFLSFPFLFKRRRWLVSLGLVFWAIVLCFGL